MGNKQSNRRDRNPPPSGILEFHPIEQDATSTQNVKSPKNAFRKLRSWYSKIKNSAADAIKEAAECDPYTFLPKYEKDEYAESNEIQSRKDRQNVEKILEGESQMYEETEEEEEEEGVVKKEEEEKNQSIIQTESENTERPAAVRAKQRFFTLLGDAAVAQSLREDSSADDSDELDTCTIHSQYKRENLPWLQKGEFERQLDPLQRFIKAGVHRPEIRHETHQGLITPSYANENSPTTFSIIQTESENTERPAAVRAKQRFFTLLGDAAVAQSLRGDSSADDSDELDTCTIHSQYERENPPWLLTGEFERQLHPFQRFIQECQSKDGVQRATTRHAHGLTTRSYAKENSTTKFNRTSLQIIKERQSKDGDLKFRAEIGAEVYEAHSPLTYAKVTSTTKLSQPKTANQINLPQEVKKPKIDVTHSSAKKTALPEVQFNESTRLINETRGPAVEKSQVRTPPVQHKESATKVKETSSTKQNTQAVSKEPFTESARRINETCVPAVEKSEVRIPTVQHELPATKAKKTPSTKQNTQSWDDHSGPIKRILTKVRYVTNNSGARKKRVDKFLAETKKVFQRMDCNIMKNCTFSPAGSSFEGTDIDRTTDFDMLLILPQPYRGENFQALESKYPGYYKLKWKGAFDYDDEDDYYDEYEEYDDYYEYEDDDYYEEYEDDDYPDEYEGTSGNKKPHYEEDEYDGYVGNGHRDYQGEYDDCDDEYDDYEDDEEYEEDYFDENANVDFDYTDWPKYVRYDGVLQTWDLLQYIFKKLKVAMDEVNSMNPEWKLKCRSQFTSFIVSLKDSDGNDLKVDVVPQIGKDSWEGLPGLRSPKELASPFQDCLTGRTKIQFPIFFSLVPAPYMLKQRDGKCLVTTAFSMMERQCLKASDVVRNAVIFAKLLSKNQGWKKSFGLRPFHMKRVAAKYFDELKKLSSWDAFIKLLEYISTELRSGGIEGYFIKKQKVFSKAVRTDLASDMEITISGISPKDLIKKPRNT